MGPTESAHWLIGKLSDEAELHGRPLNEWERKALVTSAWKLSESDRHALFALHNWLVAIGRVRIEREKALGVPTKRVRLGLRLPKDWDEHYMKMYRGNVDWFITAVMQSMLMKNELAGETKRWKSA